MYLIFRSVLFENERDQRVDRHTCIPSKAARMRVVDPSDVHATHTQTHENSVHLCELMASLLKQQAGTNVLVTYPQEPASKSAHAHCSLDRFQVLPVCGVE